MNGSCRYLARELVREWRKTQCRSYKEPTIHTGLHGFEDWCLKDIPCSPDLDDSANLLLQVMRATFVCGGRGLGDDLYSD